LAHVWRPEQAINGGNINRENKQQRGTSTKAEAQNRARLQNNSRTHNETPEPGKIDTEADQPEKKQQENYTDIGKEQRGEANQALSAH